MAVAASDRVIHLYDEQG
jgi:intraflagellar transport protein 172